MKCSHESIAKTQSCLTPRNYLLNRIEGIRFSKFDHFVSSNHQRLNDIIFQSELSETNTDQTLITIIIVEALTQWCSHCHFIDSFFMMMIFIQWIQYKEFVVQKQQQRIRQFEIYCLIHNSHWPCQFQIQLQLETLFSLGVFTL